MPGVPIPSGYVRPDPEPAAHLPTLKKSAIGVLNDGSKRPYSTRDDYVQYLVSQGIVRNPDDLIQNYSHLIGEIFFQWIATSQLGCLFAAKLAKKPRENRWIPIVQLRALWEGKNLGGLLNAHLDGASATHEAAAIIFPDVNGDEEIVALVNALCSDPSGRWYWTQTGIEPDERRALGLIGLRWILASGGAVNYVLGFASIPTMPFTRQSPFTALFLRIGEQKRTPVHREDNRVQVHLADLDSTFTPQPVHDKIWELTKALRANSVEPQKTAAARARVTFAISTQAMGKLCGPRNVTIEKEV
jgi:hypothetical protein